MPASTPRLLAEFIGTFFLVLVIGMTAVDPELPRGLAPVAVAATLVGMIFALGHVSGAHFNPMVTLAFAIRRAMPRGETIPFVVVQVVAALLAGMLCLWSAPVVGDDPAAKLPLQIQPLPATIFEFLFTFALVTVILNVALSRRQRDNQFYGLAVGMVVLAGAYVAGPVSGAAFNPAVTVALGTMGLAEWSDVWSHFAGQVTGGLLAVAAFTATERGDGPE